jgi:uncharacterized protein (DUF2252 family)
LSAKKAAAGVETVVDPAAGQGERAARFEALRSARDLKMARSTHAYVRGSTAKFYDWLSKSKAQQIIPDGPSVWICGDCHVGNLGPIAGSHGRIDIQIRDLDQTVVGNPAHDLIRLGLSLATAARSSDLPGVTTARILEETVQGYIEGLGASTASGDLDSKEPDAVAVVRRKALMGDWETLANERLENPEPSLPLGKKFWALEGDEKDALQRLIEAPDVRRLVLSVSGREGGSEVTLADAAYWKKGCSSLGFLRFAALIRISESKKRVSYGLLDLKEAVKSVAPIAPGAVMPKDNAERVVAGARALSPNLGERMLSEHLMGKSIVIRELLPQDLKIELEQFTGKEAPRAARYLAEVIGRAHGRQLKKDDRNAWIKTLNQKRTGGLDAPNWLWTAVVDLSATHEAAYLEHCRRYALEGK